ncbi:MAG: hypothetical protein AAGJ18_13575 [Bacteroidota bacterium]
MSQLLFHPVLSEAPYATVIIPIAVPRAYTYVIPDELVGEIEFGMRVEVQFGKSKLYAGIVVDIHQNQPTKHKPKPILSIIDSSPIIHQEQYQLWQWMAQYYCCTVGQVMNAALPAGLKLNSETTITLSPVFDDNFEVLNDKEYLIAEALTIQSELKLEEVQAILNQKRIYPIINKLLEKRVIYLKETLVEKYKPKKIVCVRLQEPYASEREQLQIAFDKVGKAERQMETLMAFLQLERTHKLVRKSDIYKKAKVGGSVVNAMVKKGIFELHEEEISRLGSYEDDLIGTPDLSEQQVRALQEIEAIFQEKNIALLHGVTGSGKKQGSTLS